MNQSDEDQLVELIVPELRRRVEEESIDLDTPEGTEWLFDVLAAKLAGLGYNAEPEIERLRRQIG